MTSWTAQQIVAEWLAAGFAKVRQKASAHSIWRHPDGRTVVVSMHAGDVKEGTLSAIRRQSKHPFAGEPHGPTALSRRA